MVEIDSYTPNAMFHDIEVKIRNTTASSSPTGCPWKVVTKKIRAAGKKPKIGTLWRTSRRGSMTTAAFRFVAIVVPYAIAKTRDRRYAANILATEYSARSGS